MVLSFRFAIKLGDVEALMAKRGVRVTYGAILCWTTRLALLAGATIMLAGSEGATKRRAIPARPKMSQP